MEPTMNFKEVIFSDNTSVPQSLTLTNVSGFNISDELGIYSTFLDVESKKVVDGTYLKIVSMNS
jgi:hypothetical protein